MPPRLELLTTRWSTSDLPILPFLAPRVFKPWPFRGRRVHSGTQATHAAQWGANTQIHLGGDHSNVPRPDHTEQGRLGEWEEYERKTQDPYESSHGRRGDDGIQDNAHEAIESISHANRGPETSDELSDEEEFRRKYENIWGPRTKKRPLESAVETLRKVTATSGKVLATLSTASSTPEKVTAAPKGMSKKQEFPIRYLTMRERNSNRAMARQLWEKQQNALRRRELRCRYQKEVRHNKIPEVRPKWVRLALGPGSNFYTSSGAWNRRFVALNLRHEKFMNSQKNPSMSTHRSLRVSMTLQRELIEHKTSASLREAWERIPNSSKMQIWPELMITVLEDYPRDAFKVLEATYIDPYPPAYAISDSVDFIISHYLRNSPSGEVKFEVDLLDKVRKFLVDGPRGYVNISQSSIHLLLSNLGTQHVKRLYTTMVQVNHPLHENTLIQFASSLSKGGENDIALDIVRRLKDMHCDFNSSKMLRLFSTLLQQADPGANSDTAVFKLLLEYGVSPNIITYNVLLQNSLRAGDHETGWQIHDMMRENGIEPDAHTYSILLNDSKLRMDASAIRRVVDNVRQNEMRNSHIVTDILHAILLLHQHERETSNESSGQSAPLQISFDRLLQVYSEHFHLDPLTRIIPGFSERYSRLSKLNLSTLSQDALADPPAPTLVVMITGFLDSFNDSQSVKRFYDHFRDLVLTGDPVVEKLAKTTHVWNLVLMAFSKFPDRLADCPTVIGDMLSAPDQPTLSTAPPQSLLEDREDRDTDPRSADSENDEELPNTRVSSSEQHIATNGARSSNTPVATRQPHLALANQGRRISQRPHVPPKPDLFTWSILLKIFIDQRQPRAAEKVLSMMKERGVEPSQITWNTLILGYARMQDTTMTVDVVHRLEASGHRPDDFTMSALNNIRNRRGLGEALKRRQGRPLNVRQQFLEELRGDLERDMRDSMNEDEVDDFANEDFGGGINEGQ